MKKFRILLFVFFPFSSMAQQQKLTLQEAVRIAIQNNYDVTIAKNESEIGKINNSWSNTNALPDVGISGTKGVASNNLRQELSNGSVTKRDNAVSNTLNAALSVSWNFFDGMKMYATKKRLTELEKMGEINFRKMINNTAYEITSLYYNIVRLRQQANAVQEIIALYQERLKVAENRFKIGSSPKTDFLQAQVDLNEQQSGLISIENSIRQYKASLNTVLARDPATDFNTEDSFTVNRSVDLASMQAKLSKQNPDILLAQENLAVLMQTKKEINSQRLPSASLNSSYNFAKTKNAAGFTLLNQTYGPYIGVGVSIPIYSGGNVNRQLKVTDIQIKNQDLIIKQIKSQAESALYNSYLNYTNGLSLSEVEQKNMLLVKENNMINLERFKKLSITSVELRQGQINYSDAQTRLINALFQAKLAEAEMLLLTGELSN